MEGRKWLTRVAIVALIGGILGPGVGAAASSSPRVRPQASNVVMLSTQFNPVNEAETFRSKVLAGSPVGVDFVPADANTFVNRLTSEEQAHHVTVGVMAGLYGDLEPLAEAGQLQDLTPLIKKLQKRGFPQSFLQLSGMGKKGKHYFVPWMQATYVMAANMKALKYLPKGAKVNSLTYDQLIAWGKNLQKKTGRKLIGLPAGPTSLIHRFVQGYLYPSFTHSTVTQFKSKAAVKMWQKVRQLWLVSNPQSTNYNFMQEPLLSGEVWVAWDHVARLINAVTQQPAQFRLVPSPRGPAGLGYMLVIGGLAIPKGAPDTKSAEKLIDFLTQPAPQINTLTNLAFFPATNVKVPVTINTGTWLESLAVKDQAKAKNTVPALVPVGLGTQGGAFNKVYVDTFRRIAINGENIQSVLNDEAPQLQATLNASGAKCWAPDKPSKGTCQVK